jgi:hypothetical protein
LSLESNRDAAACFASVVQEVFDESFQLLAGSARCILQECADAAIHVCFKIRKKYGIVARNASNVFPVGVDLEVGNFVDERLNLR